MAHADSSPAACARAARAPGRRVAPTKQNLLTRCRAISRTTATPSCPEAGAVTGSATLDMHMDQDEPWCAMDCLTQCEEQHPIRTPFDPASEMNGNDAGGEAGAADMTQCPPGSQPAMEETPCLGAAGGVVMPTAVADQFTHPVSWSDGSGERVKWSQQS